MSDLEIAKVHPHYLHSNSTSHTWVFGAFAELIDNVHDLGTAANLLRIDAVKLTDDSGWCITFTDNGNGLSSESLLNMLSFGYTDKHRGANPVGQYGNGFKSASMRIGKDVLVFTKYRRTRTMSVGFLSQTYHENTKADTVRVPIVQWDTETKQLSSDAHKSSLAIILEYSIFRSEADLLNEFEFRHDFGTRIVIFNLKKNAEKLELDLESDKHDILSSESTGIDGYCRPEPRHIPDYRRSLKQYCAILYLESRVKIVVRGIEVKRIKISETLSDSNDIEYKPRFLKSNEKLKITYGMARPGKDYGMCLYYKKRLISAYKKVGCQKRLSKTDGDQVSGYGVVGVVDADPVLTPIHNKQDFEKNEHYNACMNTFNVKLRQYWREIKGVTDVTCADDDDSWVQCKLCEKYRRLTDGTVADDLPDSWNCSMNTDTTHNRCEVPQEKNSSTSLTYLDNPTRKRKYGQQPREQKIAKQTKKGKSVPVNEPDQLILAGPSGSTDVADEVADDGEVRLGTGESANVPTTSSSSNLRRQTRSCTAQTVKEPETVALTDSQTVDGIVDTDKSDNYSRASRQRAKLAKIPQTARSNVTSLTVSHATGHQEESNRPLNTVVPVNTSDKRNPEVSDRGDDAARNPQTRAELNESIGHSMQAMADPIVDDVESDDISNSNVEDMGSTENHTFATDHATNESTTAHQGIASPNYSTCTRTGAVFPESVPQDRLARPAMSSMNKNITAAMPTTPVAVPTVQQTPVAVTTPCGIIALQQDNTNERRPTVAAVQQTEVPAIPASVIVKTEEIFDSDSQCSNPKCVEVRTRLDCLRVNIMSALHDRCTQVGCVEPEDVDKLMDDLARQIKGIV